MNECIFSLTEEERKQLNDAYLNHVLASGDSVEDAKRKCPKHWAKFVFFSPPRSGIVYKGVQCNCGFEYSIITK